MALVAVANPCCHGNDLRVLEVPEGADVWSPTCTDARGNMRRHRITAESPGGRPRD